ncbi:uncharacterized protein PITG_21649 [Phytophthora infestans T30-4]|uniref:Uncharacterized protein n=1 Tax=Phytophthora infestans (strain T30-4) TaxID=403677 RepID=D0P472_PHYIT|nr:uncharacterized protein PITG_21649 [Phytophthora infestans T30-4]EEY63289.1 conserved hypothetical protein [Phytophthora infestans T30-4]|eukprot:XP_002894899.1 conserved hypothetical protein [Phytophthora infestans T30-4]
MYRTGTHFAFEICHILKLTLESRFTESAQKKKLLVHVTDLGGAISWRRRDLDLSVALRSMVFVNETVSLPPRQLVSVALDRASALLVGALDVQSVSMASLAVPRWSDFVLLHRVKNGGEWQVSGELQSSDARWLKTAEVVLAPRTAKSQASQVSGCDGVNERDTGGRGVVAIRGGGGLSLGPEHTGPSVSGVDCTAAADRGGEPGGRACVGFDGGLGRGYYRNTFINIYIVNHFYRGRDTLSSAA